MARRRPGTLVPLEARILDAGMRMNDGGDRFHGFALAERISTEDGSRLLAQGTLYKALARLLEAELLTAAWEDPMIAEAAKRPRRKLYLVTPEGTVALAAHRAGEPVPGLVIRPATAGGLA